MPPFTDPLMNPAFAGDVAAVGRIEVVPQILEVVCRTTGLGFSAVARVTDSLWVTCAVHDEIGFGLKPADALPVETTVCNAVRQIGRPVAIDHAALDAIFCGHPALGTYGVQSFISVPIRVAGGHFFGTLCASDVKVVRVSNAETIGMFTLFADLIGQHLDCQERRRAKDCSALNEGETGPNHGQFIETLGHDMRNPLSAITGGVEVLRMHPNEENTAHVLDIIEKSTSRLTGLISEALDSVKSSEKTA